MEYASSNGYKRHAYSPLPDGHIRLARFHRDPQNTARLVCSFQEVHLKSPSLQYIAISYYWGDPTPVAHLATANNQALPLTKSAENILHGLVIRHLERYYWIDQICIDQEDAVEKSKQVSLMGSIYSSAFRVIAWLGNSYAWGEQALRFVLRLYFLFARNRLKGCPGQESLPLTAVDPDDNGWQCLRKLLYHPWFQRQWIVQEVLMAPIKSENEEPAFYLAYGAVQVSWDVFGWTMTEIASEKLCSLLQPKLTMTVISKTPMLYDTHLEIMGLTITVILTRLRDNRRKGQIIPMSRALITCERFRVADPRDKLYSIIGFAFSSFPVKPDYLRSVEEIYTELGHQLVAQDSNLLSLHSAGIGWNQAIAGLPSWVPDWTTPHAEIGLGNAPGVCHSRASLNTKHTLANGRQHTLRVSGHAVCTIKALFPMPTAGYSRPSPPVARHAGRDRSIQWIKAMREFLKEGATATALSDQQTDTFIALTLVAHSWNYYAEADTIDNFHCWESFFLQDGKAGELVHYARLDGGISDTVNRSGSHKKGDYYEYARLLGHFTKKRIAFGTSKHRLLGLGPPKAEVGDVVAVLHGAQTPFLLRPHTSIDVLDGKSQTWRLVGDCYVHGIMNGEGMSMAPEQIFTLV